MLKRLIFLVLSLTITALALTSCGGGGGGGTPIIQPYPTPPAGTANWTLMVYLDAANDLDTYAQSDLNEMMAVGSTANVNVIVQYKGYGGTSTSAVRYKVEKGSLVKVADLGRINMASGDAVRDFITFAVANYPANHYSLVLWDHGNGWKTGATPLFRSILTDWEYNGAKSPELANFYVSQGISAATATTGVKLDIIGVDACIMAVMEAAYEFRNNADFLVSSQELVQVEGWDYRDLLVRLTSNPGMSPQELSSSMVASYKNYAESHGFRNQTMSALRLGSGVEALAGAVGNLASSLRAKLDNPATRDATLSLITSARALVQDLDTVANIGTYVDLYQLSQLLEGNGAPVQTAIQSITVNEYHGSDRPGAHGLSIVFFDLPSLYEQSVFLKRSIYDPDYINLTNTRKAPIAFLDNFPAWPNMLNTYYTLQYPDMYAKLQNWPTGQ